MQADKAFLSDQELIVQLKDRQRENAGILYLYDNYFEHLSWWIKQNNGTEDDAKDIFQEAVIAFVNMVQQDKFRGESSIKTVLFSLNRYIWLNELKKRGRTSAREKKYGQAGEQFEASAEISMEQREAGKELVRIMDRLGEKCKKILLLFYYENYSMKQILSELDYENEQVARNKKYKCLKQLEEMLKEKKDLYAQFKNLLHG
jgi:RNA polymerase sigma factor (sigma-70 family)